MPIAYHIEDGSGDIVTKDMINEHEQALPYRVVISGLDSEHYDALAHDIVTHFPDMDHYKVAYQTNDVETPSLTLIDEHAHGNYACVVDCYSVAETTKLLRKVATPKSYISASECVRDDVSENIEMKTHCAVAAR